MPGKKLNEAAEKLTGRSQRKSLMKELNESQLGRGIKGFQEYAEKMNQLDALMEKYSVPNSFGAVEMLDPKAREAMLKAMRETAEAGEEYLKNAMAAKDEGKIADLKKGLPAVVNRLQGTLNWTWKRWSVPPPTYPAPCRRSWGTPAATSCSWTSRR